MTISATTLRRWLMSLMGDRAQRAFNRLAEQMEARARELNGEPGHPSLCYERTKSRVRIYRRLYPRLAVELDYEEQFGVVAMRRYRLDHPGAEARVITNLRYIVSGTRTLDQADYRRLARQVLLPLEPA
jgi:hypothetical protein